MAVILVAAGQPFDSVVKDKLGGMFTPRQPRGAIRLCLCGSVKVARGIIPLGLIAEGRRHKGFLILLELLAQNLKDNRVLVDDIDLFGGILVEIKEEIRTQRIAARRWHRCPRWNDVTRLGST